MMLWMHIATKQWKKAGFIISYFQTSPTNIMASFADGSIVMCDPADIRWMRVEMRPKE